MRLWRWIVSMRLCECLFFTLGFFWNDYLSYKKGENITLDHIRIENYLLELLFFRGSILRIWSN